MSKAVVYLRVSTKEQGDKGYSLPTQLLECQVYAAKNEIQIFRVIQEDMSGQILERPGLSEARELIRSRQVDAIIAHDSDRVTRDPEHYMMLRHEWADLGIRLHYAQRGEINLNEFGHKIVEDIRGRFAEEWSKKIREASIRGKRGKVSDGKVIVAKRAPLGYKFDEIQGQLVVYEPEAEIVRLIFKLYTVDGLSGQGIAVYLTQKGVHTPGDNDPKIFKRKPKGFWSTAIIRRILSNETYTGTWHWGKQSSEYIKVDGKKVRRRFYVPRSEWIAVKVPSIIDIQTFELAQKRLEYNKKMSPRNSKNEYLMAKRLSCGRCKYMLYAEGRREGDKSWFYYRCSSKNWELATTYCHLPYFRVTYVDDVVWWWVKELLSDYDLMRELIEAEVKRRTTAQATAIGELAQVREKIGRKEAGLEKLLRKFASSDIENEAAFDKVTDDLNREIKNLKQEEEELLARLGDIPSREELDDLELLLSRRHDFGLLKDNEPFEIRKAWVEALNVTGVLRVDENEQQVIDISCWLKPEGITLPVAELTDRSHTHSIQIHYTLPIVPLAQLKQQIERPISRVL